MDKNISTSITEKKNLLKSIGAKKKVISDENNDDNKSDSSEKKDEEKLNNSMPRERYNENDGEKEDKGTNTDHETEINKWTKKKQLRITKLVYKLKYNRAINNFFFFELKSKENFWAWAIIVLSTLTTAINLLNNLESEPFKYFFVIVKIILTLFTILITLIAAWMKKQQYVERINTIDRYNQKINKLIEEIEVQLILIAEDRDSYDIFRKKYQPQITEYLSTSPAMSPTEWKKTVYNITVYYPELINQDGLTENKLWPWFAVENDNKDNIIRTETSFGKNIKNTYSFLQTSTSLLKCYGLLKCCNKKNEIIDIEKGEKEDDNKDK